MTTSTVSLTPIAVSLLRDGMTTLCGVARNVRTEYVHGQRHVCWSDDTPERRLAPFDAVVQVTPGSVTRPLLVATAQAGGATRAVTLTVTRRRGGDTVVTLHAYDSAHPGEDKVLLVAGGPDREALVEQARETAIGLLRPSTEGEPCNCWAGWDPYCGAKGCWGDYRHPHAVLVAATS